MRQHPLHLRAQLVITAIIAAILLATPAIILADDPTTVTELGVAAEIYEPEFDGNVSSDTVTINSGGQYLLSIDVFAGTMTSHMLISNPVNLDDIQDYDLANYHLSVLNRTDTTVEIEVVTEREVNTSAPYPVDSAALGEEETEWLTDRPGWIQVSDPDIAAQANLLAGDSTIQAEVVDTILQWVRANVSYDYAGPMDASSVYDQGRAYCVGYANLSIAMLRAVGIPARSVYGGVANINGWSVGEDGGRHQWIEVYYPDLGWVASDPQASSNFVDSAHIANWTDQSGREGTVITILDQQGTMSSSDAGYLYTVDSSITSDYIRHLASAHVPTWGRVAMSVNPGYVDLDLSSRMTGTSFAVEMSSLVKNVSGYRLESATSWIVPGAIDGTNGQVYVDITSLEPGSYTGSLEVIADSSTTNSVARASIPVLLDVNYVPTPEPVAPGPGDYWVSLPYISFTN